MRFGLLPYALWAVACYKNNLQPKIVKDMNMSLMNYVEEIIIAICVVSIAYYAWKNYKEERRIKETKESKDK
jgi:hypothetical protein